MIAKKKSLLKVALLGLTWLVGGYQLASAQDSAGGAQAAAKALVQRVVPAAASKFAVEIAPSATGKDFFEIESSGGKVVLRGNNPVSVASALNWYLKNYAHCQMSWCGDNLDLPETLPVVPEKVRVDGPYKHRVYFNYCTFSYTAPWWDWKRWEREIDWMAMHGVNMPLMITGQEAVWQNTLRRFKMNDDEIRKFLCGPGFFAWQYMANLEGWGGPLPQSWIDSHTKLARQILARERELSMTPILQGFTGFVPRMIKEKYPQAEIKIKPNWCDVFPGVAQLDPTDPLFKEMGVAFIEEQTRLFGTDHWYAADLFHESAPPKPGDEYLTASAKSLFETTIAADKDGKIAMQTWSMRKPIVEAIPEDRILMLHLTGGGWQSSKAMYGRPWVCGMLHNYGGRVFTGGMLKQYLTTAPSALNDPNSNKLCGVGMFAEAIEQNPIIYEAGLDVTWMNKVPDLRQWSQDYLRARYGNLNEPVTKAWDILLSTVYSTNAQDGSMESTICSRPALKIDRAAPNAGFRRNYDPEKLWQAWDLLQQGSSQFGSVNTYQYDLVDTARQALADISIPLQRDITIAYRSKNKEEFKKASQRFLDLASDMDRLLGTRKEFLLGKWIKEARAWGTTEAEKNQYEWNARMLVTAWGPSAPNALLFDYSNRQWSGLIKGYYIPRWKRFLEYLDSQPDSGPSRFNDGNLRLNYSRPADNANEFYTSLSKWEQNWSNQKETYADKPEGNSVQIAGELLKKWKPVADEALKKVNLRTLESGNAGDAAFYAGITRLEKPEWTPEICTTGQTTWSMDVAKTMATAGEYAVTFTYTRGAKALEIFQVSLSINGKEVSKDAHKGSTGNQHTNNVYKVKLEKDVQPTDKVDLLIRCAGSGGQDSNGTITIQKQ